MSVYDFHGKPVVPALVAGLDHAVVIGALAKHSCNVTRAAEELGVPVRDLRKLMWANPAMQELAYEMVEERIDRAEAVIIEALHAEDSRRRDAAAVFILRNTPAARPRGWAVAGASQAEVSVDVGPRAVRFRWKTDEDDARDAAALLLDDSVDPTVIEERGG